MNRHEQAHMRVTGDVRRGVGHPARRGVDVTRTGVTARILGAMHGTQRRTIAVPRDAG